MKKSKIIDATYIYIYIPSCVYENGNMYLLCVDTQFAAMVYFPW